MGKYRGWWQGRCRTGVLCDYKVAADGAGNILIARFRSPARHRPHTPTQSVYRGVRDTKSVYPCCVMFSVCAVTCNVVISPSVSPDSLYKWSGDKGCSLATSRATSDT